MIIFRLGWQAWISIPISWPPSAQFSSQLNLVFFQNPKYSPLLKVAIESHCTNFSTNHNTIQSRTIFPLIDIFVEGGNYAGRRKPNCLGLKFKCDFKLVLAPLGSCIAYTMTETPKRDFHKAISRLSDTLRTLKLLPPFKTQNC